MAIIRKIRSDSPFFGVLKKGDDLREINGNAVKDFLDYMFFSADMSDENGALSERPVSLTVIRKGRSLTFTETVFGGDLRLDFEDDLMDDQKVCHNKCVFCFIDQMPKNMRDTLYYKDDDFRLSLIYGNYITMTNLSDEDIDRIIRLRVSPLNISVHTTNPELRVKMMANPRAAKINENLSKIYEAGLEARCQIVLCKGINDGEELDRTMRDLKKLYPSVTSVSIVPVGLTKYREGLYPLESFAKEDAARVLKQINDFGDDCLEEIGARLFYPADEFFLQSGTPIPDCDYYENFEQIENGVGMTACFDRDFREVMASTFSDKTLKAKLTLVTGVLIFDFISAVCEDIRDKFPNVSITVYPITNKFFGEKITVAGLVTGGDIIEQLKGKDLGDCLLIPGTMLKDGKVFLDDITLAELSRVLKIKVSNAGSRAEELVNTVISVSKRKKFLRR